MKKNTKKIIPLFLAASLVLLAGNFCYGLIFAPLKPLAPAVLAAPQTAMDGCAEPEMNSLTPPDFSYDKSSPAGDLMPCCVNQQDKTDPAALASAENTGSPHPVSISSARSSVLERHDDPANNFILESSLPPPESELIASTVLLV